MNASTSLPAQNGMWGPFAAITKENRFPLISGIVCAIGALIIKLIHVFTAPIHWDTNYYLNTGSHFIERGGLTPYMWRMDPSWNIVSGGGAGYGILPLLLWLKTFGLSINSGQVFMYLVGLATLPLIYWFVSAWYGKPAGWWAVILTALSGPFMVSFYVRMDAPAVLADCAVLCLYAYAVRQSRMIWHVLVGVALIVAVEVHVLALLYAGALVVLYGIDHLAVVIQKRRFWVMTPAIGFGGGLAAGFALYAVIHILPNPDIYFLISRTCDLCVGAGLPKEIDRYSAFIQTYPIEAAIFLLSIGVALWRHGRSDRRYLLLVAGCIASMAIMNPPATIEYTGHFYPVVMLGAGLLVAAPANDQERRALPFWHIAAMGIAMLMLIAQLNIRLAMPPRLPAMGDPENAAAVAYIREHIPHDAIVMGPPTIYADLLDYPSFLAYKDGTRFTTELNHETYRAFWTREKPQVIAVSAKNDPALKRYMTEFDEFVKILPNLWIRRTLKQH